MQFEVKAALFEDFEKKDIEFIRETVFIKEQNISRDIEFDDKDKEAFHTLIYSNNKAVATGRILKDGRIGRVAVLKEFRKNGLGVMVMNSLISQAKKEGIQEVFLDSQEEAINFYEKLGFEVSGKMFIKAQIKHQKMSKYL